MECQTLKSFIFPIFPRRPVKEDAPSTSLINKPSKVTADVHSRHAFNFYAGRELHFLIHYYVPTFACRLTEHRRASATSRGAGGDERSGIPTAIKLFS